MNQRYFLAATIVGGVPWMVPLLDDDEATLREIYERLDGVLIPGGVDLDPATFGESKHPKLGAVDPARDRVELQLVRWALADRKPVLGLCRGIQVMNVALGGTLYQDLAEQVPAGIKHDYFPTAGFERDHLAHEVSLAQGSRLRAMMERPSFLVNSMHHQGIKSLGSRTDSFRDCPRRPGGGRGARCRPFLRGRPVASGGVRDDRPAHPPPVSRVHGGEPLLAERAGRVNTRPLHRHRLSGVVRSRTPAVAPARSSPGPLALLFARSGRTASGPRTAPPAPAPRVQSAGP